MQNMKGLNPRKGLTKVVQRWDTLDNIPSYQSQYSGYGYEPSVTMDFVNNVYTSDLNFTRLGNATMTDSDGLLKWAPHNLVCYSEDFANAYWTPSLVAVNTAETVGPYPGTRGDGIVCTQNTVGVHTLWNSVDLTPNIPANTDITVGAYFKYKGSFNPILVGTDNAGNLISVEFNIHTVNAPMGAITTAINTTRYSMKRIDAGSGNIWYYCTMTYNVGPANAANPVNVGVYIHRFAPFSTLSTTGGFSMFGFHVYREDLKTVNSPGIGVPYIKSTDTPKFGPRIGHHINGVNEGFLLESASRSNILYPSNDFTSSRFPKYGVETYMDGTISPSGFPDAYKVINNLSSSSLVFNFYSSITTAITYSIFIKRGNFDTDASTYWGIYDNTAGINIGKMFFDFGTETLTADTSISIGFEKFANGWYRIWGTFPNTPNNQLTATCGRNGFSMSTLYHYQYGMQLEAVLGVMTSYIPTTTTQVTRAAESGITVPTVGKLFGGPLSFAMKGKVSYYKTTGSTTQVHLWRFMSLNGYYLSGRINTSGTLNGRLYTIVTYSGGSVSNGTLPDTYNSSIVNEFNIAAAYTNSSVRMGLDGMYGGGASAPTMATYTDIPVELGLTYIGTVKNIRVWPVDLNVAGCWEVTT